MVLGLLLGGPTPFFLFGQAVPVEIHQTETGWELLRNGAPYYVKGAGGHKHLDKLVECGGNTIRTWGAEGAGEILDAAHQRGLTVCLGLWVGHERHGFDYNDDEAIARQLEKFRAVVEQHKDHPALLMWGIGNEVDLSYTNTRVWDAIGEIAALVQELDPHHPTMTVTAGIDREEVRLIRENCPHIDILGINSYADVKEVPEKIREFGWKGPYMITEWGPTGHWESPKYEWEAPREQTGAEKADVYLERYQKYIESDQELNLGSFVFLWGQKQETTTTWYGLFLPSGEATEAVDVLQYVWTGNWPENRAPQVSGLSLNGQSHLESIYLRPGQVSTAQLQVVEPDGDPLEVEWKFVPESTDIKAGGDFEETPEALAGLTVKAEGTELVFHAPEKSGAYRLFVVAQDGTGKAGVMNLPFFVR